MSLAEWDIDAVGCFLEFLYTGEYFPKKIPGQRQLEPDSSVPQVDETGDQLLKHARVYTLAEKFEVPQLKALASSKIHCVNSTAKGEIAYARYVYAYTTPDDTAVRTPITKFWAARSHTLRAEAEDEFKSLCLEFPQFGYDVLSKSLRIISAPMVAIFVCTEADGGQAVSWTRNSSASGTRRCTRRREAHARGPDTAAVRQLETPQFIPPAPPSFFISACFFDLFSRAMGHRSIIFAKWFSAATVSRRHKICVFGASLGCR